MNKNEHISTADLINFAKGAVARPGENSIEGSDYERIVLHLGDCAECLQRLRQIQYVGTNFDEVWKKLFPITAVEVMTEASSPEGSKIIRWISDSRIRKELTGILGELQKSVESGIRSIIGYNIPAFVTTHGEEERYEVKLFFVNSVDISIFDKIEYRDNVLTFYSVSDPGYKKICLAGPDKVNRVAGFINYGPESYIARFEDIKINPEGCFIHLF